MTKKAMSRGRGPRIREDELEKMVALYLEGKTFKAIANEVGRHWQTVRKYTMKALQEREGRELRREALKGALVDHFKDMVGALGYLNELLHMPEPGRQPSPHGWWPPIPELRNRLLLQALRDSHARESPLWSWWDSWNQAREAYEQALPVLQQKVTRELARLKKSDPGISLTEGMPEVIFYRGGSVAQDDPVYDPSMLCIRPPTEQEGKSEEGQLWLGQSTHLATGRGMGSLLEKVAKIMAGIGEWKEIGELARLYRQMAETKEKMEEEVAVLSLKRAFPGRCRLCPV